MTLQVILRDLEPLLKQEMGRDVSLLEYSTEPLLPPGENYGSTIFKVQAVVKRNGKEEDLHLVAKMMPTSEFQRTIFDSPFTFKKEIFFYKELMPAYQKLERDFGFVDKEMLDVLPRLYGTRISLNKTNVEKVDDNAVILMDNLLVKGFYLGNRREGLDLSHAKVAVESLAHFHALGIAMKHKRPEFFEVLKIRSKCLDLKSESFDDVISMFLDIFRQDPVISKHFVRIEAAMTQESARSWSIPPEEPWSTIVHQDFWMGNILFKNAAQVKFIDFQNYLFMSPLRELSFFLTTGLNEQVSEDHFDQILDMYYDKFMQILGRFQCDLTDFARDKFDARLKIDAFREFPHGPYMLKMMMADYGQDFDISEIKDFMRKDLASPALIKRLRIFVSKFAEKGWL